MQVEDRYLLGLVLSRSGKMRSAVSVWEAAQRASRTAPRPCSSSSGATIPSTGWMRRPGPASCWRSARLGGAGRGAARHDRALVQRPRTGRGEMAERRGSRPGRAGWRAPPGRAAQGAGPVVATRGAAGRGAGPAPHRPGRGPGCRGVLAAEPRRPTAEGLGRLPRELRAERPLPGEQSDAARPVALRRLGELRRLPSRRIPGAAGFAARAHVLPRGRAARPEDPRVGRARPVGREGPPCPASRRRRPDPPGDEGRRAGLRRRGPVRFRLGRPRADPRRARRVRSGLRVAALRLSRGPRRRPGREGCGQLGLDLRSSAEARTRPRSTWASRSPRTWSAAACSATSPTSRRPWTARARAARIMGSVASGATGRRATTCWPSRGTSSRSTWRSAGRRWPRAQRIVRICAECHSPRGSTPTPTTRFPSGSRGRP